MIRADFEREYQIRGEQLARMGVREFRWRLAGLSDASRFRTTLAHTPRTIDDPAESQALLASL